MYQYIIPLIVGIIIWIYIFGKPFYVALRRANIKAQAFPKHYRQIIKKRIPYFAQMPTDLQLQLKKHILVFLDEKEFIGFGGIKINDDIRVTVATQACLLLLNRRTNYYPKLKTIAIYPSAFIKKAEQKQLISGQLEGSINVVSNQESVLAGESWDFGRIVLSWQDTVEGAKIPDDGANVVIHEFAHQLDQQNGPANGFPRLSKTTNKKQWTDIMNREFHALVQQKQYNQPSLLSYYGATNPAEFFAVASEVFFEQSAELYHQHNALYTQLKSYYRVDPINWH